MTDDEFRFAALHVWGCDSVDEAAAAIKLFANRHAAQELEDAADTYDEAWPDIDSVTVDLRNRAEALDPA